MSCFNECQIHRLLTRKTGGWVSLLSRPSWFGQLRRASNPSDWKRRPLALRSCLSHGGLDKRLELESVSLIGHDTAK